MSTLPVGDGRKFSLEISLEKNLAAVTSLLVCSGSSWNEARHGRSSSWTQPA